jgi:transcriptional regulator GlxA family with amidase domain
MPKTPRITPNSPRRIGVLTFQRSQLLDVSGPLQVFATANDLAVAAGREAPYAPVVLAREPQVRTTAGLVLQTTPLDQADLPLDTLIIAGGRGVDAACEEPDLVAWAAQAAAEARRVTSVCSGAFLLAATGLLDGRRAVTHWDHCADFAERFPKVRLDPEPIFIRDGDVWTSAGVTAGIDLALALVEDDLGRSAALAVARQLVVFLKRPGGQSQFSAALSLQKTGDRFDTLHAWIAGNLRQDLSLQTLAERAGMSSRSFSRHYRQLTGETPARAVERLRVEAAKRLLEERSSVAQAARACGFGSEETLRRSFVKRLNINPQAYRERF